MVDQAFGSNAVRTGYTEGYAVNNAATALVAARLAADGTRPRIITHVAGAVSGRGATRTVRMYLGGSAVTMSRASAASAQDTGYQNSSDLFVANGGSLGFGYDNMSGSCYFGRSSTSGASGITGAFVSFTGTLGGGYRYVESPTAPSGLAASSPEPGVVDLSWAAPSDNGGTSITGYQVKRATNAGMTADVEWFDAGNNLSYEDDTATPGSTYYYQVFAENAVTEAAETTGVGSSVASVTVQAGGRRWTGSAEVAAGTLVRWNGSAEVPITEAVRWDGDDEVPLSS